MCALVAGIQTCASSIFVGLIGAPRPVAGGQAPDVLAVVLPAHRVLDRIGALGQGRATAVLEIIDAARAHVVILDAAEIDPDLAVLVSELRREAQVLLAFEMAPAAVVGARPCGP